MTTEPPEWTRIVLIRHGESASNAGGWISGQSTCGGLTDLGILQAEMLRARLERDPDLAPDVVLVSTMPRAVQTAEIVAGPHGLDPEQRAELMERTSGEAEGLTIEEYTRIYGKAPWIDWDQPLSPGGESGAEFAERVHHALERIVEEHTGRTVWVVCHGGVIMVTAAGRWPEPISDFRAIPVVSPANTSLSEWIVTSDGRWRMGRYNDHTHLLGMHGHDLADAPAAL